ncbi:YmfQ family protein [Paracandidimonas soli]|uniref:YmfQ family protein n=1 Tax=Paracandidimonas soli TaxID=1917182 RepID=UPI00360CA60B
MKTEGDYYRQLLQLLPLGPAWDSDLNPGVHGVLRAAAREFARIDARADDLLGEMVPTGVRELLPDWERVMGLPDRCTAVQPQFWQRRAEVVRRFGAVGEQRPAYFIQIAALMGYPGARVIEHRAPRFGRSRFGAARWGTWGQQFIWTLQLGMRQARGLRWGAAMWGNRFGVIPGDEIECVIRRYAPSHTVVFFEYET